MYFNIQAHNGIDHGVAYCYGPKSEHSPPEVIGRKLGIEN